MAGQELLVADRLLNAGFVQALEGMELPGWVGPHLIRTTSDQPEEKYAWFGMTPKMTVWDGEREITKLKGHEYTLPNVDYANGIEIDEPSLRRQKFGQFDMRVAELAGEAVGIVRDTLIDLINTGAAAASLGYDGVPFFSAAHPVGGGVANQSNLNADYDIVLETAPTSAELSEAVHHGIRMLLGIKNEQGRPANRNARSFTVLMPIEMMEAAGSAFLDPVIAAGSNIRSNTLVNLPFTLQYDFEADLSDPLSFYVFRTDGSWAPFILQEEVGIQTAMKDERFDMKRVLFGATRSFGMGYALWERAVKITLDTA